MEKVKVKVKAKEENKYPNIKIKQLSAQSAAGHWQPPNDIDTFQRQCRRHLVVLYLRILQRRKLFIEFSLISFL